MPGQSFAGNFDQLLPQNCVVNTTPPTFAGISGTTPNTDGSITATWLAGSTSGKDPIEYEIYITTGVVSAGALFVSTNKATISPSGTTSKKIFTLADQTTYLVNGQQYTMGVRAVDSQGYTETNVALQTPTAVASGNLPVVYQTLATNIAATEVLLAADHVNFQGDHTNFQTDHTNFQADDAAFDADHAAFQGDHTNFQTDHTNFQTDHSNLQTDHSNFMSDLATFSGYLSTFNGYLATFNTYNSTYNSQNATFATDLATLATDLATLATDLSTFSSENVILTAQVSQLAVLVGLLSGSVSSQTGSAGLQMTFVQNISTMTMSVE